MAELSKFCPWCGADLRPKAIFCHRCGHPLPQASDTQGLPTEIAAETNQSENILTETPTVVKTVTPEIKTNESTNGSSATIVKDLPAEEIKEPLANNLEGNKPEVAVQTEPPQQPVKKTRKTKRFVSRTEYVWEEAEPPVWSVILFSVAALGLVLLLLWLNGFLR